MLLTLLNFFLVIFHPSFLSFRMPRSHVNNNQIVSFSFFLFVFSENSQLDDLYTRYRKRLRKSLFISGLGISLISCLISIILCYSGSQVNIFFQHLCRILFSSPRYLCLLIWLMLCRHSSFQSDHYIIRVVF